jgi:hypothetical protein
MLSLSNLVVAVLAEKTKFKMTINRVQIRTI